jgi:hypothetical protein
MVRRIAMLFNAAEVRLVVCMLGATPCTERSMMQRLARRWILALALGALPQLLHDFARDAQRFGTRPVLLFIPSVQDWSRWHPSAAGNEVIARALLERWPAPMAGQAGVRERYGAQLEDSRRSSVLLSAPATSRPSRPL